MTRKLPKGKVTVEGLLASDEMKAVLDDIRLVAPDVVNFVFAYETKEGSDQCWKGTYGEVIFLLEVTKRKLLDAALRGSAYDD